MVAIFDESNVPQTLFRSRNSIGQSYSDESNPFRRDAILLSHLAFFIKKRKECIERQVRPLHGDDQQQNVAIIPKSTFVLGQSNFYLPLVNRASGRT